MSYTQAQINAMTTDELIAAGMPVASDSPYVSTGLPSDYSGLSDSQSIGAGLPALPSVSLDIGTGNSFFDALGAIEQGLLHPIDTFTQTQAQRQAASDANSTQLQGAASTATSVASGVSSLLNIVTDIPRLATILVGGLLLAAGIFSIAGGSHKDIINLVKSTGETVPEV